MREELTKPLAAQCVLDPCELGLKLRNIIGGSPILPEAIPNVPLRQRHRRAVAFFQP